MDRSSRTLGVVASALLTGAGAATPLVALLSVSTPARAQLTQVEPYYVVVTEDNVNLRCGAGSVWYAVGKVNRGQVLRVDGHEFGWLRVDIPPVPAIARRGVRRVGGRRGATRESRLQANNPGGGVAESWRQLLDEPLPADTVLQHIETLRSSAGEVTGYRVVAPGAAKGFISDSPSARPPRPKCERCSPSPRRLPRPRRERPLSRNPSRVPPRPSPRWFSPRFSPRPSPSRSPSQTTIRSTRTSPSRSRRRR